MAYHSADESSQPTTSYKQKDPTVRRLTGMRSSSVRSKQLGHLARLALQARKVLTPRPPRRLSSRMTQVPQVAVAQQARILHVGRQFALLALGVFLRFLQASRLVEIPQDERFGRFGKGTVPFDMPDGLIEVVLVKGALREPPTDQPFFLFSRAWRRRRRLLTPPSNGFGPM